MRVLITNNRLDLRGGAETFVRDLARALNRRGHQTIAYSSDQGQRPRLLESDLLPVTTEIDRLPFRPDVIHGQHHLDAMTAVLALPGVPAIYMTHGATWRGVAPEHPRIYRYVAVSRTQRERLIVERNIDPDRVSVFFNGIDLARFSRVRTPPVRPRRALIYHGNQVEGSPTVAAIREACAACGVGVEAAGHFFDRRVDVPEDLLPEYDVVFAAGRSAIEALASGCAVIVMGRTSCGGLVTAGNFDHFRSVNFTIPVNSAVPAAAVIATHLRAFDAADVAAVTARTRAAADFDGSVSSLLDVYEAAMADHREAGEDLRAESLAASRYLRTLVPLVRQTDMFLDGQWSSAARATSFEELRAQLRVIERQLDPAR